MKKIGWIWILCGLLTACNEKAGFDHLDGMWQMQTLRYEQSGETIRPQNVYYSFQMHIAELRKIGKVSYKGLFDLRDDSIYLCLKEASREQVEVLGLNDTIQHFAVETLTDKRLVLHSDYARLEFRKW